MSRLSFRPHPLDIRKKFPIVKSFKDFEDEETPTTTRTQILRIAAEADNELQVQHIPIKKVAPEIPIPEFVVVDTYERDYSARSEIGEFVEYDLDNEDEDWLLEFN